MAKRKLEGTVYLDPQRRLEKLGELRRMVRTRQEIFLIADLNERNILNNMVIRSYRRCKQSGAGEDEIKVAVSGLKEAKL